MPSSELRKPNFSRRFLWLGVFIAVLFGGYSAAWYYFAGKIETIATAAIAGLSKDGTSADCAKPTARGFPFRIGLYCDSVRFEDQRQNVAASAAAFRSAAQVYDPFHVVAELDSPAAVSAPRLGEIGLEWDNLRASVRLTTDFPERLSVEADGLAAGARVGDAAATSLLNVGHAEGHMRRNGADLDLAASFAGARLDPTLTNGATLPPLAGEADLTLDNGIDLVRFGGGSLRGRSGTIRKLTLSTGEATGLSIMGSFSVSDDGLLDADFTVGIRNPKALAIQLAEAFPAQADQIRTSFAGLAALGDNPSLPLKIARGKAKLGFIPLGDIPPL
jgi:hypothetical protein